MPINFSLRNKEEIQAGRYLVSEKTDGTRYFLCVLPSGAFFIDRKYSVKALEPSQFEAIKKFFVDPVSNVGSLVDGELVRSPLPSSFIRSWFLLFLTADRS